MKKSADAFRTISEVADWLDTPTHVLRFWESKFSQIKPVKRAGGRRYYRPKDMLLIGGIKQLLHEDGLTIKGAQKVLRERGAKHVSSLSQPLGLDTAKTPYKDAGVIPTQDEKITVWQPIQIADLATDVSDDKAANLDGVSEPSQEVMAQEPPDSTKDFDKFRTSFDADQPALNFWAQDEASEANAEADKEPLPKVEPSFESVMNILSSQIGIGKSKAMLLQPILLHLEKRLGQRQSGHFK